MTENPLSAEQVKTELEHLHVAWSDIPGQGLVRVFHTSSFGEGLALVTEIGQVAKKTGRYPVVTLRHNEVEITTQTADSTGVTAEDITLAKAIDELDK